ncbi:MAG: hypothetical protein KAH38_09795, partial [Candidatus Hydrogenedentes bacterium]|nr:hypothetical protein [Candidatus Hydrogenedentota bacterium]
VVIDDYTEFEVTVQGETGIATYQWYFDDGILGAVAIPGAESSILAIPVAIEDNSGQYWCTVTDDVETLPSATITLVVTQGIPLAGAAGLAFLGTMIIAGGTVLMGRYKKK